MASTQTPLSDSDSDSDSELVVQIFNTTDCRVWYDGAWLEFSLVHLADLMKRGRSMMSRIDSLSVSERQDLDEIYSFVSIVITNTPEE